ncbi:MAG: HK97 gp10 family phage protein [Candidatus Thiodiazotropha taylori]
MSGLDLSFDSSDLKRVERAWSEIPDTIRDELSSATWEAEMLLLRAIKEDTPVGATSVLRESIYADVPVVNHESVSGIVGSSALHAMAVELGTKPHFPPLDPLVDWVQAKLDIKNQEEAESVALSIARKIAARGTEGQKMFQNNFHELRPSVEQLYKKAHHNITEALAHG